MSANLMINPSVWKSYYKEEDAHPTSYHGTYGDFDKFDDSYLGNNTAAGNTALGHFFTNDPTETRGYGPNIKRVYLDMKHPLVVSPRDIDDGIGTVINEIINTYGDSWNDFSGAKERMIRGGYDGIVIDFGDNEYGRKVSIPFSSWQIHKTRNRYKNDRYRYNPNDWMSVMSVIGVGVMALVALGVMHK